MGIKRNELTHIVYAHGFSRAPLPKIYAECPDVTNRELLEGYLKPEWSRFVQHDLMNGNLFLPRPDGKKFYLNGLYGLEFIFFETFRKLKNAFSLVFSNSSNH